MSLLYTLFIYGYHGLVWVASGFNTKAKQWIEGRTNVFENLQAFKNQYPDAPIAWFHCASLGEFEQGRPLIERYSIRYPDHKILLTFFSPSGYEIRKNYPFAHHICYLPSDTPSNAKRFVAITKPVLAVFVKYEFWHFYLLFLQKQGTLTVSISAIFRQKQVFFKWYGGFWVEILARFNHIFVQNQTSFDLLKSLNLGHVSLSCDTRFDRVAQIAADKKAFEAIENFKGQSRLLIAGSCWQADFDVILPLINQNNESLKFIIAPHEIHEEEIEKWRDKLTVKSERFSSIKTDNPAQNQATKVLMIDNIGMLSSLYQYADFAWIGGAYGKGLHNILEAATFGMPSFFGNKNYQKFQEAHDLIALDVAFAVENTSEFLKIFKQLFEDSDLTKRKGQIAQQYVSQNIGASQQILEYIDGCGQII